MNFKLWSELNSKAKKCLKPDFGFRPWDSLNDDDKYKIWKHLELHFFDRNIKRNHNNKTYYHFFGKYWEAEEKEGRILYSIVVLNNKYKANAYTPNFLENTNLISACADFYNIFAKENSHVVLEMLSLYCKKLISERSEKSIDRKEDETIIEYENRLLNFRWADFDKFSNILNEVFNDFGINICLTRQGFIPRQEEQFTEQIYLPVLKCLSHAKWKEVNRILSDSFDDYRKSTPQGYSSSVTNAVAAIQAFLQIIVYAKTGKGEVSKLISEAQKKGLIPNDFFTTKIFNNIESIFARERQETGLAHPKKEYATEKNARLILNLAMIFLQHCIQK